MTLTERVFVERPGSPLCEDEGNIVYAYSVVNDLEYKLYLNRAKQWCVRICDDDTKEWIVPICKFPLNMDVEAVAHYNKAVTEARRVNV